MSRTTTSLAAIAAIAALGLAACSSGATTSSSQASASPSETTQATQASSVSIDANDGPVEIKLPVTRAASLDNRTFEVLQQWDVPLVAVPKKLIPSTVTAYNGEDIADVGMHRDPNLEALVAANPDLIISGQRFSKFDAQIKELAPDVPLINLEPREGKPFNEELIREVTDLGEIFGKQDEAKKLVDDFNASIERAKKAYDGSSTVMAVDVSGGNIGYVAPGKGRTWGPVFDLLGLKPALEVEGSTDSHTGDDISVEAIAEANPAWIFVLDRDAAITKDGSNTPAETVINDNAALQNVAALQNKHVLYAPNDTYTNESIITYTEIFNSIADAFEAAKKCPSDTQAGAAQRAAPAPRFPMTHSPTTTPPTGTATRETTPASSKRRPLALALATLAVAALLVLSLSTGEYSILSQDDGWQIFLAVRVPRTIALVLSGAAMSMSGLVMQLVTQNRFAEPSTTGTTEWAGLGLLVIMIVWPGAPILVRMTCAIVFAFVGTMVFFALLRRVSLRSSLLVPIMGMMLGAVVSAISTFLALETNTLQSVSAWFQGSFTSVYEGQYEVLWIVAVVVAIVFVMADRLTAVSLGEDIAVSLGVNYHRMILIATGLVAVATGVVTVVVGSLPFLGLIVPNLVSMSMGDNLRTNLPWVCLAGIALVTVTDLLARTIISPFEMPVSVILGVLGSFVFIALVLRQARKGATL